MKKKKRKQEKSVSTSNGGAVLSEASNQVNISLNSSLAGEISEWRNWVILHEESEIVASSVWNFGRKEKIIFRGDEGEVIKELEEIETRDREKSNSGKMNSKQVGESIQNGC
ncbi:hypothetical protein A2U01_0010221 [Trifolium medium]|uniref:Uncharacterized protein n=2 Tax=Trifolium medium TaxID=97028 RepID=A0A392MP68_9FABA|nr:hypothetical protein [Trifolium medium]